jgi:hypothetical protein
MTTATTALSCLFISLLNPGDSLPQYSFEVYDPNYYIQIWHEIISAPSLLNEINHGVSIHCTHFLTGFAARNFVNPSDKLNSLLSCAMHITSNATPSLTLWYEIELCFFLRVV